MLVLIRSCYFRLGQVRSGCQVISGYVKLVLFTSGYVKLGQVNSG
jgi:hypothetical protein